MPPPLMVIGNKQDPTLRRPLLLSAIDHTILHHPGIIRTKKKRSNTRLNSAKTILKRVTVPTAGNASLPTAKKSYMERLQYLTIKSSEPRGVNLTGKRDSVVME